MLKANLFVKNIELYLLDLLTINTIKMFYLTYMIQICSNYPIKKTISENKASYSVILCYIYKKIQMTKIKAKKLSLQFVPYLFIVVTILTAFGSNSGTWAWMISKLVVWIKIGLIDS